MTKFFKSRRPGPTDLTWQEKECVDYIYYPKDTTKLEGFVRNNKPKKGTKNGNSI